MLEETLRKEEREKIEKRFFNKVIKNKKQKTKTKTKTKK